LKEERRRGREIRWKREMVIIRRRGRGKVEVGGEVSRHDVCVDRSKYCLVFE